MICVNEINSIFSKSHSETDDFVNSAKQNPDVFLDHSTLLNIEQEDKSTHGNVTLTFNVGKDNLEVNTNYIINLISHYLTSVPRCVSSLQPRTPSSCMAGAGPACPPRPASLSTASGVVS